MWLCMIWELGRLIDDMIWLIDCMIWELGRRIKVVSWSHIPLWLTGHEQSWGRVTVGECYWWCWWFHLKKKKGKECGWSVNSKRVPQKMLWLCSPPLLVHWSRLSHGGIQGSCCSWMGCVVLSFQSLGFGISLCSNTDSFGAVFCFQILTDKGKYPPLTLWDGKRPIVGFFLLRESIKLIPLLSLCLSMLVCIFKK